VQGAIDLHHDGTNKADWQHVLAAMMKDDSLHGMLRGYCCRLLYEQGVLSHEELATQIALAVTPAIEAAKVAQWMQGFLQGSGQMLLQFDPLWNILNDWLCTLSDDIFGELVALLRRSFAEFSGPELRMMGEKIKKLQTVPGKTKVAVPKQSDTTTEGSRLDWNRVEKVIPVLHNILYGNEKGET